jgi:hypothetical protein
VFPVRCELNLIVFRRNSCKRYVSRCSDFRPACDFGSHRNTEHTSRIWYISNDDVTKLRHYMMVDHPQGYFGHNVRARLIFERLTCQR